MRGVEDSAGAGRPAHADRVAARATAGAPGRDRRRERARDQPLHSPTGRRRSLPVTDADDPGPDDGDRGADRPRPRSSPATSPPAPTSTRTRSTSPPVGSRISVQLTNLPADYDLTVTGPPVGGDDGAVALVAVALVAVPLLGARRCSTTRPSPSPTPTRRRPRACRTRRCARRRCARSPLRSSSINRVAERRVGVVHGHRGRRRQRVPDPRQRLQRRQPAPTRTCCASRSRRREPAPACIADRATCRARRAARSRRCRCRRRTRTLILVNQRRLAQLYPGPTSRRCARALNAYAARADVGGVVVPVESDPQRDTDAAYAALGRRSVLASAAANDVVEAVNARRRPRRAPACPTCATSSSSAATTRSRTRACADLVSLANERDLRRRRSCSAGATTRESAAAREGMVLTDDALRRLRPAGVAVRPPVRARRRPRAARRDARRDRRAAASSTSAPAGGSNPTSALVAGYDFLADGANAVTRRLGHALRRRTGDARIDETWTGRRRARPRSTRADAAVDLGQRPLRPLPRPAGRRASPAARPTCLRRRRRSAPAAGSLAVHDGLPRRPERRRRRRAVADAEPRARALRLAAADGAARRRLRRQHRLRLRRHRGGRATPSA